MSDAVTVPGKELKAMQNRIAQLEDKIEQLAKILVRKDVAFLVDPLLTDEERDVVFDAIIAIEGE